MTIKNTNAAGFDEYDSNGFHKGLLVPAAFQMAWVDFRARSETGALALRDAINLWRRLGVPHAFEEGRKELFDAYIWLIDETNVIRNRVDQGKQLLIDMQVSNASDAFAKAAKELAEFNINLEAARPHGAARSAAQKAKSNSEMIEVDLPIEE
jgi:hypothetical protein